MATILLWLQLAVAIILVIFLGAGLAKSADVIAEKSGLGRTWVGAILLAGVTSLPELATGISAVTILDAPDLAAGAILGSCLFNLVILAILDFVCGPDPLFQRAQMSHGLAAGLGCVLLGIAAVGMVTGGMAEPLRVGWVSVFSLVLLVVYFLSGRMIAQCEVERRTEVLEQEAEIFQYQHIRLRQAYVRFVVMSIGIVLTGIWLAGICDRIAEVTGLGESFVGALLLAATTSLPEVVTSISAIRLNAVDLAVSNVFGSNVFNLGILGLFDLAYWKGDLLATISPIHLNTALVAMIMTSVAIVGLVYRAAVKESQRYVTWDGVTLIVLYLFGMYMVYNNSPGT
ncbi:hypothetical protein C1752_01794 [Acaryochloris thomasi RCC1774]|uniref:Sodium/calcium exchanger membrane region domain-containing protein n=1 Tax=Acaryochloris thomasi RCC1774 TaxID=1764569 RepID=A0A2W1JKA9_9CYAN|nr:sodium:calcium antiporter [Acaryochloris thomasi]PZD73809.1 hypothetical protein C1752_01794 [Acaryochloris thomasi RCC1774]